MADQLIPDEPPIDGVEEQVSVQGMPDEAPVDAPIDAPVSAVAMNEAPVDAPYEEEQDGYETLSWQGMSDKLGKLWTGTKETASLALQGLDTFSRATSGNAIRALDPEAYKATERALAKEAQDPDSIQVFNDANKALNAVAPNLHASDYVSPAVRNFLNGKTFKAFGMDWRTQFVNEADAHLIGAAAGFIADWAVDPLTWMTLGASTPATIAKSKAAQKELSAALKAIKGGQVSDEILRQAEQALPKVKSFVEQVHDGEKIAVGLKIPFKDKVYQPLPKALENKIAKAWTDISTSKVIMDIKRRYPSLQMRTGLSEVDNALTQHTLGETAHKIKRKEMEALFPKTTENVQRITNAMADYGEEKGLKFLQDADVKVSEDEVVAAKNLYGQLTEEVARAKQYAETNGVNINDFEAAKIDERAKLTLALENMFGGEIPKELKPYVFREQYGLPRAQKKVAVLAEKSLETKSNEWMSEITGGGKLKTAPSSAKESEKYSTTVMNLLKQKKTGMVEAFEVDPVMRTMDRVEDIYRSVADKRFVDSIKKYSGTKDEMISKINQARAFVIEAKTLGIIVPNEIKQLATLNPKNLKNLGEHPWHKISGYTKVDEGAKAAKGFAKEINAAGEAIPDDILRKALKPTRVELRREELFFPPEVAAAIENRFGEKGYKGDGLISQALTWVNDQFRRSVLTNFQRLFREGAENTAAYSMAKGNPRRLIEATSDSLKFSLDPKKNKADAFTTAFFNSPYADTVANFDDELFKKPMSYKEATDINTNNVPFYQIMHDAARTGREQAFDEVLGITKKSLTDKVKRGARIPLDVVEFINNNKVAKTLRNFAGGTSSNINKLALAKTYHYDKGIPFAEALRMADEAMVSFSDVPKNFQRLRNVSPFILYNVRNIQRLPMLFASSPSGLLLYDKIKRAWGNAGGWSPEDQVSFRNILGQHFQPDPIIGPFIKGTNAIEKDPFFIEYGNKIGQKVLGEGFNDYAKEKVMSIYFPDPFRSALNFTDPESAMNNLGPLVKAGVAMLGLDPYTGKPLPYNNTILENGSKLEAVMKQLNPLQFNEIYRTSNMLAQSMKPKFVENLVNMGMDPAVADQGYKMVYGDNWIKEKKKTEAAYNTLFNWSTLGFGRLNNVTFQGTIKTMALAREIKTMMQDLQKKAIRGDFNEAERQKVVRGIKDTVNQIHYNKDLLETYNASIDEARGKIVEAENSQPTTEDIEIQSMQSETGQFIDEANELANPQQEEEAPKEEEETDDVSMLNDGVDRRPAMGAGGRPRSDIFAEGSYLTQKYLEPEEQGPDIAAQEAILGKEQANPLSDENFLAEQLNRYAEKRDPNVDLSLYRRITGDDPKTEDEEQYAISEMRYALDDFGTLKELSNDKIVKRYLEQEGVPETSEDYKRAEEHAKEFARYIQEHRELPTEDLVIQAVKDGYYYMSTFADKEAQDEENAETKKNQEALKGDK